MFVSALGVNGLYILLRVLIKPRRATTSPHIVDQGVRTRLSKN